MKIRRDLVFVSSVLLSIALVYRMPAFLRAARAREDILLQNAGFASLANILVGLVVIWMGFVKRVRWAWFVMLIIVSVWAFPVLLLPLFQHSTSGTLAEWLSAAWREPGIARITVVDVSIVSLMVIALILPIRLFIRGGNPD